MISFKNILSSLFVLLFCLQSCGQNNNQHSQTLSPKTREELAKGEYRYVTTYNNRPVYSIQVKKQGCRLILEAYSEDYRFTENNGESMTVPFNYMITNSGNQQLKVKIYPKEGETYITKYAHVQLTVYFAPDKDSSLKDYKKITTFTLPQNLVEKKLPYYETTIEFDAKVPFDYSKDLKEAKDLKSIPNLREKLEKKYLEVQKIAKNDDAKSFVETFLFSFGKTSNTTYQTLDDLKSFYKKGNRFAITSPEAEDKDFLPLDDTEMQFYAGGKIVALWHKKTLTSGLDMKYNFKKEDGAKGEGTVSTPVFFYIPGGSNDLKVW